MSLQVAFCVKKRFQQDKHSTMSNAKNGGTRGPCIHDRFCYLSGSIKMVFTVRINETYDCQMLTGLF